MTGKPAPDILAILSDPASSLARIQRAVADAEKEAHTAQPVRIGLSSNITIELLEAYLKRHAWINGVPLEVHQGNYDDPLSDMERFIASKVEYVILLPFFDNLLPSFEAQLGTLAPDTLAAKEAELHGRYRLIFEKAASLRSVFLCGFHRYTLAQASDDPVSQVIDRFNLMLREEATRFPNIRFLDMQNLIQAVGHSAAFDPRFYFRARAPYAPALLNRLALQISLMSRGFGSYFYKALVLDCDNTLWGGIIGEDLLGGIRLEPHDYPGNIFWRVQQELAALERSGILLCLCSKNNPQDVEEVLHEHPHMVLKDASLVLKKVNWNDKVQNLRDIARELNIGLDSLVLLDDSEFECTAVRSQLPTVRTVLVPKALPDYPGVISELKDLFLAGGITANSRSKTTQYRQKAEAERLKAQFGSQEDYLASLQLKVEVSRNAGTSIPRISELTLKSNQFNVTTRRYGESDIRALMSNARAAVYSMVVSDKFGNAGLTGVAVMRYEGRRAVVESFLMSCRVIGRGAEFAVWDAIIKDAAAAGCEAISAEFVPTAKNAQVADFYDRLGLTLTQEKDGIRRYERALDAFAPPKTPWIEVTYAG
jgi:FkbH-like protein